MLQVFRKKGSMFKSDAEMLVNPVNIQGIAGAGLALEFKNKFPKAFVQYKLYCTNVTTLDDYKQSVTRERGKLIYALATKTNWKEFSNLGIVRYSLLNLVEYINTYKIKTIAIPPLGCGLGGLDQINVLHLILYHLRRVEHDLTVELFGFKDIKPKVYQLIKLRYDFTYREQDRFAGVGSREIDEYATAQIEQTICPMLHDLGFVLSTGDATGADSIFYKAFKGKSVRYAPAYRKPKPGIIVVGEFDKNYSVAEDIAASTHPSWRWLPDSYKKLHTRNVFQILSRNVNDPVEFVICWTPDGAEKANQTTKKTGGTGTAIRIASTFGVPVFNLYNADAIDRLKQYLNVA
jgi:Macro domain.